MEMSDIVIRWESRPAINTKIDRRCLFHGFFQRSKKVGEVEYTYPCAVVEYPGGTVEVIDADYVHFVDDLE